MSGEEPVPIVVDDGEIGERLDRIMTARLAGMSRSRAQALIRGGAVHLAGAAIGNPGHRAKAAETYRVSLPAPEPATPVPEAIPLAVVYEDDDLIVVDKPAGMVVHPAAGHARGTLVNALLAHCGASLSGIGGVKRPGFVHRLDKGTSGLIVVAKTDLAHQGLAEQFASHGRDGRLLRRYQALVWGPFERKAGLIDAALERSRSERTRISVSRRSEARHAITHYQVRDTFRDARGLPAANLVELALETGRTHQIRVHLEHIGHPVLGDPIYGLRFQASASRLTPEAQTALARLGRQALHATELGFEHPRLGKRLEFRSALPTDISVVIEALRQAPARPIIAPSGKGRGGRA